MNSNKLIYQCRGRLIVPTADLSACVYVADKSAVGTINRPLQKAGLVHHFVHPHYRSLPLDQFALSRPFLYGSLLVTASILLCSLLFLLQQLIAQLYPGFFNQQE